MFSTSIQSELKKRDELADFLKEKGIGTGVHYPVPIHKQPYYKELGYRDSLPVSEKAAEEVLSLPVHPALSEDDVQKNNQRSKRVLCKSLNNFQAAAAFLKGSVTLIRVGVIGTGAMGQNHVRIYSEMEAWNLPGYRM